MTHGLIIDDNADNRLIARLMLEELGIHATEAGSVVEGLSLVTSGDVDFVLLDWMMPDIDGIEFLELLRESAEGRKAKIIMCTAKTSEADKAKALANGATGFLAKPITTARLSQALNAAGIAV